VSGPELTQRYGQLARDDQRIATAPADLTRLHTGRFRRSKKQRQSLGLDRQQVAGLILAEQHALIDTGKAENGTDAAQEAHLGHGHGEPTIR
jgi:hypothetical protein